MLTRPIGKHYLPLLAHTPLLLFLTQFLTQSEILIGLDPNRLVEGWRVSAFSAIPSATAAIGEQGRPSSFVGLCCHGPHGFCDAEQIVVAFHSMK